MVFLDCNLSYGTIIKPTGYRKCDTIDELISQLKRAGIAGGLVHCIDCDTVGAVYGNKRIAKDIKASKHSGVDLKGMWALLPPCTKETPSPIELPSLMQEHDIAALYCNPAEHMFMPRVSVMGDYYAMAEEKSIPIVFYSDFGFSLEVMDDILETFPNLRCIIDIQGHWPKGRQLYPFLERYPNTYVDLAYRWEDRIIEDIVSRYGASRILFGTGFPVHYLGGAIAQVIGANISEEDKRMVSGGNLLRLLREARLV